jgi:hypothetical protein
LTFVTEIMKKSANVPFLSKPNAYY